MKKVLPLLMLASTCLSSCGEATVYGKYKFLLGRQGEGETRVSIEMELKDEASSVKAGYKNFTANIEMGGLTGNSDDEDEDTAELLGLASEVASSFGSFNFDPNGKIELPGFYKVSDLVDEKYGNKVKISFDLGETINDLLALFELEIDLTDIVSHFVVSYCNNSAFTLQIPVSLDDIQMQLAWYGTYIDYDPYLKDKVNTVGDLVNLFLEGKLDASSIKHFEFTDYLDHKLPGEQNTEVRYGSHPRVEIDENNKTIVNEVEEMNEKYQGLFSNTFIYEDLGGYAGKAIGTVYKEITEEDNYYFFPYDSEFNTVNTPINVIMKRDIGILDYDFSEQVSVILNVNQNKYEDGSHGFSIQYADPAEGQWDWKLFYKKPFVFRDYHDIKIELKKE